MIQLFWGYPGSASKPDKLNSSPRVVLGRNSTLVCPTQWGASVQKGSESKGKLFLESPLTGLQTHMQGGDLSLLCLLASLQPGLPSLPLCLSHVPEHRQVGRLICSHTVFPAHPQDACPAWQLQRAPSPRHCSSQHQGLGAVGFSEHSSHHGHSPFLCMVGCGFVPLSSFPTLLDVRDNPGAMQRPKMSLNLVST